MSRSSSPASVFRPNLAPLLLVAALALVLPGCSNPENGEETTPAGTEAPEDEGGRVTLSQSALEAAGIQEEEVAVSEVPAVMGVLEIPGQVAIDSTRIAVISPRVAGRLESTAARPGARVEPADSVAVVSSPAYLAAQSDVIQAARRAELLEGTDGADDAGAVLAATRQRLLLLGASNEDIDRLLAAGEPALLLPLRPPFTGTILESLAQPGTAVEPGTPVYRMADLRTMHVIGQVPETALARVRPGIPAEVSVPAYPDRTFAGEVAWVLEELDPETRSVGVVVEVPNPDGALKAGMFATVRLNVGPSGGTRGAAAITLPSEAVLADGAERFVFVEVAPRTFERRDVEIAEAPAGAPPADRVVIAAGLSEGERVVTQGAVVLRSELGKGSLVDDD